MFSKLRLIIITAFLPFLALANGNPPGGAAGKFVGTPVPEIPDNQIDKEGGLGSYLEFFGDVLSKYIIPLLITLGLVLFLFGLLKYITAGADEEKRTAGRNLMIYGIIALFVMVSVWGLVAILNRTFGIGQGGTASGVPGVKSSQ